MTQGEKEPRIAVPGIGMDGLAKVITGLYARYPTPTKYSDLATAIKMSGPNASSALSLAKGLGLAKIESGHGRGAYVLTDAGKKFGLSTEMRNEDGRKAVLREAVLTRDDWKEVIVFLKSNPTKAMKTTDLSAHVASQLGRPWKESALEAYGSNYATILSSAGLVTYDKSKGTISALPVGDGDAVGNPASSKSGSVEAEREQKKSSEHDRVRTAQTVGGFPLTINITIDAKDKEGIDGVIRLIRTIRNESGNELSST